MIATSVDKCGYRRCWLRVLRHRHPTQARWAHCTPSPMRPQPDSTPAVDASKYRQIATPCAWCGRIPYALCWRCPEVPYTHSQETRCGAIGRSIGRQACLCVRTTMPRHPARVPACSEASLWTAAQARRHAGPVWPRPALLPVWTRPAVMAQGRRRLAAEMARSNPWDSVRSLQAYPGPGPSIERKSMRPLL